MESALHIGMGMVVLIYSCIFHECAHVWTAFIQGDPTGKAQGRLTLNPIPHIDLFWTIILPFFMFLTSGSAIGGPKPAPYNPLNFRNPRLGSLWVALAGPASNILLAGASLLIFWGIFTIFPVAVPPRSANAAFFLTIIQTNLVLAAANLIPVPPLDGASFLKFIVGRPAEDLFAVIERNTLLACIAIFVAFRFLGPHAIRPVLQSVYFVLRPLFGADYVSELLYG
jgi:Zn-dependent protease